MNPFTFKRSISMQLLFSIFGLLIIPFLIMGYYFVSTTTSDLSEIEKEHLFSTSDSVNSILADMGKNLLNITTPNSHWDDNWQAITNKDKTWLDENVNVVKQVVPNLHFIATIDLNGNVLSQTGDINEFKEKIIDQAVMARLEKENDFSGLVLTSKGLAIIAVSKVTTDDGKGKPSGALIFGQLIDENTLRTIRKTLNVDVAMISKNGTILSTTKHLNETYLRENNVLNVDGNNKVFKTLEIDGTSYAETFTSFPDLAGESLGVLYVEYPMKASKEVTQKLNNAVYIAVILFIFLILGIMLFLRTRILKPLYLVSANISEVASGRLIDRIPENYLKRSDEVGLLTNSTRQTIQNLQEMLYQIKDTAEQLTIASKEMEVSAEQNTKVTERVSSANQEIAITAEDQVSSISDVVGWLEQLRDGATNIHNNSDVMNHLAKGASQFSEKGIESVQETIQHINQIKVNATQTESSINNLENQSHKVNSIVSIISEIAKRTNLLALNASIEASRAGEHGKGFAVVADEVRELAEQSSSSAKLIVGLIQEIQSETEYAVESVKKEMSNVEKGVEITENLVTTFEGILQIIKDLSGKVQEVAIEVEKMKGGSEQIYKSTEIILESAEAGASASQQNAAASEEQLASMGEITTSARKLSGIATKLHEFVSRFSIDKK